MAILTVPRDDELDVFLDAYDLGSRRAARGAEAGTVNTSYALDLDAGRYFLRIYEEQDLAAGSAVIARGGQVHGVRNLTDQNAVLFVVMAPRPVA